MESDPGREGFPIALQKSDAWEAATAGGGSDDKADLATRPTLPAAAL